MKSFTDYLKESEAAGVTTSAVASNPSKDRDKARKKKPSDKGIDSKTDHS